MKSPKKQTLFIASLIFLIGAGARAQTHAAAPDAAPSSKEALPSHEGAVIKGAKVFFVEPKDGATVKSPFKVKFGLSGLKLAKAGAVVPGTGHHHLIVDGGPSPRGAVIGKDATHLHFGDGQSETKLTLAPGKHTLTLQFADGSHASYGEEMSSTITVNVK